MEPDYKAMYLKMVNAAEDAIRCLETEGNVFHAAQILIAAQQACEEMYIECDTVK